MIQINKEILKELKPCNDRWRHYLQNYSDFSGSIVDFLKLDGIPYQDKIWVIVRLVDSKIYTKWSALCAQSVLHIFEKKYPGDTRPRECLEYLLSEGPKDLNNIRKHRDTAYACADAACADAAAAYAAACACAAAYAYAAACACAAAYAAADAYAAYAAADAAARINQQNKNIEILIELLKQSENI
jgi:hypothetical protein